MDDPLPIFAANVRRAREAGGMTQEALASAAGMHVTHVARIERGEREPGVRAIAKLAIALDVAAADLFAGID